MFPNSALRTVLKTSAGVLRESGSLCSALSAKPWTCSSALLSGPGVTCGESKTRGKAKKADQMC